MAKTAILRNNVKIGGYLLCIMSGFQCLAQALFFDNLIFFLIPRSSTEPTMETYVLKIIGIATTLLALLSMVGMLKTELRELRAIGQLNAPG